MSHWRISGSRGSRLLADASDPNMRTGTLASDVHLPAASLLSMLEFVEGELPVWRDRTDRPSVTAETDLTSQLCAHLNSAARRSAGWDILQFRVEEPDGRMGGRKIDMVISPSNSVIWVDGRRHVDFDTLLPIECKRLPTPTDRRRDPREYVFSSRNSTGGIQRFKAGNHGAGHRRGAMIAFVQAGTPSLWAKQISSWISELVDAREAGWTVDDLLRQTSRDRKRRLMILESDHSRDRGLAAISLRHIWISM